MRTSTIFVLLAIAVLVSLGAATQMAEAYSTNGRIVGTGAAEVDGTFYHKADNNGVYFKVIFDGDRTGLPNTWTAAVADGTHPPASTLSVTNPSSNDAIDSTTTKDYSSSTSFFFQYRAINLDDGATTVTFPAGKIGPAGADTVRNAELTYSFVYDTTDPVLRGDFSTVVLTVGDGSISLPPTTCTDTNRVGGPTATIIDGRHIDAAGDYTYTFTCTDKAGNSVSETKLYRVISLDNVAPQIGFTGDLTTYTFLTTADNPSTYTPVSLYCTDDVSSGKNAAVSTTVDNTVINAYTTTYSCADDAGNNATPVVLTVKVVNRITVQLDRTGTQTNSDGDTVLVYSVTFSRAVSDFDGTDIGLGNAVLDFANPISGTVFNFGVVPDDASYVFVITLQESAATSTDARSEYIIKPVPIDKIAPTVVYSGEKYITIPLGSPQPTLPTMTCTDNVGVKSDTATFTGTVDPNTAGPYPIQYLCVDTFGNENTRTLIYKVIPAVLPNTIPVTISHPTHASTASITLQISFGESVQDFTESDVVVTGANIHSFDYDSINGDLQLILSNPVEGTISVDIAAGAAHTDYAKTEQKSISIIYDTIEPTFDEMTPREQHVEFEDTSFALPTLTCTDDISGALTATTRHIDGVSAAPEVNVNTLGTYAIQFVCTDDASNEGTKNIYYKVSDSSSTASPIYITSITSDGETIDLNFNKAESYTYFTDADSVTVSGYAFYTDLRKVYTGIAPVFFLEYTYGEPGSTTTTGNVQLSSDNTWSFTITGVTEDTEISLAIASNDIVGPTIIIDAVPRAINEDLYEACPGRPTVYSIYSADHDAFGVNVNPGRSFDIVTTHDHVLFAIQDGTIISVDESPYNNNRYLTFTIPNDGFDLTKEIEFRVESELIFTGRGSARGCDGTFWSSTTISSDSLSHISELRDNPNVKEFTITDDDATPFSLSASDFSDSSSAKIITDARIYYASRTSDTVTPACIDSDQSILLELGTVMFKTFEFDLTDDSAEPLLACTGTDPYDDPLRFYIKSGTPLKAYPAPLPPLTIQFYSDGTHYQEYDYVINDYSESAILLTIRDDVNEIRANWNGNFDYCYYQQIMISGLAGSPVDVPLDSDTSLCSHTTLNFDSPLILDDSIEFYGILGTDESTETLGILIFDNLVDTTPPGASTFSGTIGSYRTDMVSVDGTNYSNNSTVAINFYFIGKLAATLTSASVDSTNGDFTDFFSSSYSPRDKHHDFYFRFIPASDGLVTVTLPANSVTQNSVPNPVLSYSFIFDTTNPQFATSSDTVDVAVGDTIPTLTCNDANPTTVTNDAVSDTFDAQGVKNVEYTCTDAARNTDTKTVSYSVASLPEADPPKKKKSGSSNDWHKKPTFGISHLTYKQIVDNGFSFNGYSLTVTDNWHTDFHLTSSLIGETNTVKIKTYSADPLKWINLYLGVPRLGDVSDAESEIQLVVSRDYDNPVDYTIDEINHYQAEELVNVDDTTASLQKIKCQASDKDEKCYEFTINFTVMAPLHEEVVAISAMDDKRRQHVTYINEGVEFTGESLLDAHTAQLMQKKTNQGQAEIIELTQQDRRYNVWEDQHGYLWTLNEYGTWTQITAADFERHQDSTGNVMTRQNSNFASLIEQERQKALLVFDSGDLISELDDYFAYDYSNVDSDMSKLEKYAYELQLESERAQKYSSNSD